VRRLICFTRSWWRAASSVFHLDAWLGHWSRPPQYSIVNTSNTPPAINHKYSYCLSDNPLLIIKSPWSNHYNYPSKGISCLYFYKISIYVRSLGPVYCNFLICPDWVIGHWKITQMTKYTMGCLLYVPWHQAAITLCSWSCKVAGWISTRSTRYSTVLEYILLHCTLHSALQQTLGLRVSGRSVLWVHRTSKLLQR